MKAVKGKVRQFKFTTEGQKPMLEEGALKFYIIDCVTGTIAFPETNMTEILLDASLLAYNPDIITAPLSGATTDTLTTTGDVGFAEGDFCSVTINGSPVLPEKKYYKVIEVAENKKSFKLDEAIVFPGTVLSVAVGQIRNTGDYTGEFTLNTEGDYMLCLNGGGKATQILLNNLLDGGYITPDNSDLWIGTSVSVTEELVSKTGYKGTYRVDDVSSDGNGDCYFSVPNTTEDIRIRAKLRGDFYNSNCYGNFVLNDEDVSDELVNLLEDAFVDTKDLVFPGFSINEIYHTNTSPDGQYKAVTAYSGFHIFKNNGSGEFTFLSTLPWTTSYNRKTFWSGDGVYLIAISTTSLSSNNIKLYKRTGDTFVEFALPPSWPYGRIYDCDFSADGKFLAVGLGVSPYIKIYKINSSLDNFTEITDPTNEADTKYVRPFGGYTCKFNSDASVLLVGDGSSEKLKVYKRSVSDKFYVADALVLPTPYMSRINFISFSKDEDLIAFSYDQKEFRVMKHDGNFDVFEYVPISDYPTGDYTTAQFSKMSNGKMLVYCNTATTGDATATTGDVYIYDANVDNVFLSKPQIAVSKKFIQYLEVSQEKELSCTLSYSNSPYISNLEFHRVLENGVTTAFDRTIPNTNGSTNFSIKINVGRGVDPAEYAELSFWDVEVTMANADDVFQASVERIKYSPVAPVTVVNNDDTDNYNEIVELKSNTEKLKTEQGKTSGRILK